MNFEEDEIKRIEAEALRLWAAQTDDGLRYQSKEEHISRLLHAAARKARIECWLLPQKKWIPAIAVRVADGLHIDYRIHPNDEHLQYGPISTALREIAENDSWRSGWERYLAHAAANEFTKHFDSRQGEPDYPLYYLFLAEFLADFGL